MGYFQARSDLSFIQQFRADVMVLWEFEKTAADHISRQGRIFLPSEFQDVLQSEASKLNGYQFIREQISRKLLRAIRIAIKLNVPIDLQSCPPAAVGGVIIPVNLFYSILKDTSLGGISRQ